MIVFTFFQACESAYTCDSKTNPLPKANAGCFIVHQQRLLITQQRTGLWNLPGGTAKSNESAQCTAERETWEETGINVQVSKLAKVFDNGFHLFYCQAKDGGEAPRAVDYGEVQDVRWISEEDFEKLKWRFPEQVPMMKRLLANRGSLED